MSARDGAGGPARLTLPWRRTGGDPHEDEQRTADAIYGVIVSAAVMAAAHVPTSGRLAIAVLVTLLVYWAAERYAAVMARRITAGDERSVPLREELTRGWELVTASFLPVLVLVVVDLLGADLSTAVVAGLLCSTVLLFLAGLQIGAQGHLSGVRRLASGVVAGLFGLTLIALKFVAH